MINYLGLAIVATCMIVVCAVTRHLTRVEFIFDRRSREMYFVQNRRRVYMSRHPTTASAVILDDTSYPVRLGHVYGLPHVVSDQRRLRLVGFNGEETFLLKKSETLAVRLE